MPRLSRSDFARPGLPNPGQNADLTIPLEQFSDLLRAFNFAFSFAILRTFCFRMLPDTWHEAETTCASLLLLQYDIEGDVITLAVGRDVKTHLPPAAHVKLHALY